MLLPPNLSDFIPANHPVRVINHVIDGVDLALLSRNYKGGGTSSYHPRMLLKVLVYGYVNNKSIRDCGHLGSICAGHIDIVRFLVEFGPASKSLPKGHQTPLTKVILK